MCIRFFSTSNIIVACFSLNLNGFLHLDKWKTFLFPWYGTRASTYCSCYSYLIPSHFSFCEFPLCCNSMYGSSPEYQNQRKKKLSKKEMVQNEIKGFTTNNNLMLCIWYVHQLWAPNTKRREDKLLHNTIFALCSHQIEINFQTNKTFGRSLSLGFACAHFHIICKFHDVLTSQGKCIEILWKRTNVYSFNLKFSGKKMPVFIARWMCEHNFQS